MKHGAAVICGETPGKTVCLPTDGATATKYEGIVVNNLTTEHDLDGEMRILNANRVGVMRWGRIWGRLGAEVEPAYGDPVYVIAGGEEAGLLTNDSSAGFAIKARFLGGADTYSQIAPVELFNEAQS